MYSIRYVYAYIFFCMSEINGSNITRDKRDELGIFCYNVLALTVKHYSVL